jgi:hypothetical protein
MASEIRVNKITNRVGLSTVEYTDTGIIVSGIVTATELSGLTALNIAGVGTATTLDINGDIDVDGHTNLDNVSVAGVSTFAGTINGSIGNFSLGLTASSADIDDFISVGSNIHLGNAGVITATSYRGDGSQLTGIVAGLSTISGVVNVANDLDVDGHTNLDNVSIAGVTTFSGNINSDSDITTTADITSRYLTAQDVFITGVSPEVRFVDTDNNPDYQMRANSGLLVIKDFTNGVNKLVFNTSGMVATGILTATSFSGDGSTLSNLPAGAPVGGASTNTVFFENAKEVAVNYQITTNKNAMSAGPIAINAGIAVTVPSGSAWTIV